MARTVKDCQADIAEHEKSLVELRAMMNTMRESIKVNPDNIAEFQPLIDLTEIRYKEDEAKLADLTKELAVLQAQEKKATQPEKWSIENHPILGKKPEITETPPADVQVINTFKVNDMVMARWIHGDRAFYKAKITMVMGSAAAPKFRVKFPDFNNDTDEGLELTDIKALDPSKKRKAEETAAPAAAPVKTPVTTNVISAPASIDVNLASQARQEPSKVSDGPPKPAKMARKARGNRVLEKSKSNWQAFQAKGTKKVKKESMFRTPDLPNARVGFTGSGRPMAKDPTRTRHTYTVEDDGDYEN
ncbi:uncharacterized protein BDZ99DRAFT_482833 [Mytilinidion resinicola]|uniref:Tudor domain-containing protein n=1 Tax=Mytilinidion resinicola TaxID=574789 RepID=A0A6A6Y1H2_9PEZI|nr:uncharacterized protein BDZ99DRAFT_482833 [Mytilinidion resinicola]KAF2802398.1 hypothetical protein BDZ99DRAFT_482833 [Mytilinidion resinicola]